jgi:Protein of unknown function (DUF2815)
MATSIKLKDVRLSFPDLFEAVQYQGQGAFRYNASFLIVPGSANDKLIQAAIREAAEAEFKGKAAAQLASFKGNSNKMCYVSGDLKEYDGYKGMLVLSAHRRQKDGRPLVIDERKNVLTEKDAKPYPGCYVNATVDIYAQSGTNSGMRCGLIGVQFARDGDAFSGSRTPTPDDFDAIDDGADAGDVGGDDSSLV